jgi:ATP-binding cassette subfamily C protein CydC
VSGESGAGKSTISNLVLRFLEPSAGELLLNGRNASEYSFESIRAVIGLIEQQPTVFYGTVRQNLLLAKPEASDVELIEVLQRVGLWSMVESRGGLDLFVGERAALLSGGEAARLAMARALLANFQLLILDEPTANLDAVTAEATLRELMSVAEQARVAVILISHDLAMAALTTSSVVVEKTRGA